MQLNIQLLDKKINMFINEFHIDVIHDLGNQMDNYELDILTSEIKFKDKSASSKNIDDLNQLLKRLELEINQDVANIDYIFEKG